MFIQSTAIHSSHCATTISRVLPGHLRTGQWYNDLHHTMFLILFSELDEALIHNRSKLVEYLMDTVSIYWLIHCLAEEEGMTFGIQQGYSDAEALSRHQRAHKGLTRLWRESVFQPFKEGSGSTSELRAGVQRVYDTVLRHIADVDMASYGDAAGKDQRDTLAEIAHLAETGLPLSPYMSGCYEVARHLDKDLCSWISPNSLAAQAGQPAGLVRLCNVAVTTSVAETSYRSMMVRAR